MTETGKINGKIQLGTEKEMESQLIMEGVHVADLILLKQHSKGNHALYKGYLSILIIGWDIIGQIIPPDNSFVGEEPTTCVITSDVYNKFCNSKSGDLKILGIRERIKKSSPAGKRNQLMDLSGLGSVVGYLVKLAVTNPMQSVQSVMPVSVENQLRGLNNKTLNSLIDASNALRTKSWVNAIPSVSLGSLGQIMHEITGMVGAFQDALLDIYKGIKDAILIAKVWMNQQIARLQKWIVNAFFGGNLGMILYVFCFLFSLIQSLLDEFAFFAQLFNASDSVFKMINILQTVVNWGSQFISYAYNPITGLLPALFPKEVGEFFSMMDKLDKIPNQFLGFIQKNLSFNSKFNSKAIATLNTIVKRYGLGSKLGELEGIVDSFGTVNTNNSNWQRNVSPAFNPPITLSPMTLPPRLQGAGLDTFFTLGIDGNPLTDNLIKDYSNFTNSASNLFTNIQKSTSQLFKSSKNTFNKNDKKDTATEQSTLADS